MQEVSGRAAGVENGQPLEGVERTVLVSKESENLCLPLR